MFWAVSIGFDIRDISFWTYILHCESIYKPCNRAARYEWSYDYPFTVWGILNWHVSQRRTCMRSKETNAITVGCQKLDHPNKQWGERTVPAEDGPWHWPWAGQSFTTQRSANRYDWSTVPFCARRPRLHNLCPGDMGEDGRCSVVGRQGPRQEGGSIRTRPWTNKFASAFTGVESGTNYSRYGKGKNILTFKLRSENVFFFFGNLLVHISHPSTAWGQDSDNVNYRHLNRNASYPFHRRVLSRITSVYASLFLSHLEITIIVISIYIYIAFAIYSLYLKCL